MKTLEKNNVTYLDNSQTHLCCGCTACMQICSRSAIRMEEKEDGARYPTIDNERCVSCGLCRTVCPMRLPSPRTILSLPRKAYAAVLKSEDARLDSASGGAFEGISEGLEEIYPGIMIAGAAWSSKCSVSHKLLPASQRSQFKKSKYVQSDTSTIFSDVKKALDENITVFFTGTPCQVAALNSYLGKSYNHLFTADLVCHGVGGQSILDKYLCDMSHSLGSNIVQVQFRTKKPDLYGEVHSRNLKLTLENGKELIRSSEEDPYLRAFHKGVFYRESCYCCPFANPDRPADITIGDYWHIQSLRSDMVDYTGVSCIMVNTEKGNRMLEQAKGLLVFETPLDVLLSHNEQLIKPSKKHSVREAFFQDVKNIEFGDLVEKLLGKPNRMKQMLSSMLPGQLKRKVKGWIR